MGYIENLPFYLPHFHVSTSTLFLRVALYVFSIDVIVSHFILMFHFKKWVEQFILRVFLNILLDIMVPS